MDSEQSAIKHQDALSNGGTLICWENGAVSISDSDAHRVMLNKFQVEQLRGWLNALEQFG